MDKINNFIGNNSSIDDELNEKLKALNINYRISKDTINETNENVLEM